MEDNKLIKIFESDLNMSRMTATEYEKGRVNFENYGSNESKNNFIKFILRK